MSFASFQVDAVNVASGTREEIRNAIDIGRFGGFFDKNRCLYGEDSFTDF